MKSLFIPHQLGVCMERYFLFYLGLLLELG